MINNFKSLSKTYASTLQELEYVEQGSDRENTLLLAKQLLEEIIDYLKSYKWLYKQSSKEKIKVWIESGYDYDVLCEQFNISYEGARWSVSWANSQFKKKIGENTIKLIKEGLIEEARAAFYVGTGKLSVDMFVGSDCLDSLPDAKYNIYSLAECENELKILCLFSKARLQKYLEVMDEEKMAYVLWLLTGKSKKSDVFRPYLISMLSDELEAEELIYMEEDIKRQQNYL
ncbi:MAG: hypothetical protein IKK18_04840 [Clostridia bacterium]|nr:hypothetical protein [Clostridia bacterium]